MTSKEKLADIKESALLKLFDDRINKLNYNEIHYLYDEYYLGFNNSYGIEIPNHGHLTLSGKRELFEAFKDEIKDKVLNMENEE